MAIKRNTLTIIIVLASSLILSACARLQPPGMATTANQYSTKTANPIAGKNFKLIPITYNNTVAKRNGMKHRAGKATGIGGYKYLIGSQDILSITVWDHPELTIPAGEFRSATAAGHRVGEDGKIFFPFAGKVQAKGLTTDQVRRDLEKKLAKFITKPQVGVAIAAYRSQKAFISGEVETPGVLTINDVPLTVRDVIATSGGLTEDASASALLTHHNQKTHINLRALFQKGDNTQNYVLRGGDSLHITKKKDAADKVFVMGEVQRAGSVPFDRQYGLTLAEALSEVGSINEETADPTGVFVVRQQNPRDKMPSVYQLQMTSVHSMLLAERFDLRSRDVVYVTASPIVRWNRVISRILPSISGVNNAAGIGR